MRAPCVSAGVVLMAANGIDLAELPDARITIDPRQYHSLINTVHIEIRGKLHWDIGRTSSQPSYMMKINESNLDWKNYDQGKIQFHRKELSNAVEAENLGCSLYELPPGKQSWPYHYHTANEEAVFVLAGEGQLRTEGGEKPLQSGDFITLPADERGAIKWSMTATNRYGI